MRTNDRNRKYIIEKSERQCTEASPLDTDAKIIKEGMGEADEI